MHVNNLIQFLINSKQSIKCRRDDDDMIFLAQDNISRISTPLTFQNISINLGTSKEDLICASVCICQPIYTYVVSNLS